MTDPTPSAFDANADQPKPNENKDGESTLLSELVGEGKKYRDVEALAKSRKEADEFIEKLKSENEELRQLMDKAVTEEQVAAMLEKVKASEDTKPTEGNQPTLDADKLRELIRSEQSAMSQEEKRNANVRTVDKTLQEHFGSADKAGQYLRERAEALGVSIEYMQTTAAQSPAAFFKLVDFQGDKRPSSGVHTKGSVNTESFGQAQGSKRDWAYYQKLRREQPKVYYSASTQAQMIQDKVELGKNFGIGG